MQEGEEEDDRGGGEGGEGGVEEELKNVSRKEKGGFEARLSSRPQVMDPISGVFCL